MIINDSDGGNGNGMLDPGETAVLQIPCSNTGASLCLNTLATLIEQDVNISLVSNEVVLDLLAPGETKTASYEVLVDANAPIGTVIEMNMQLACTGYTVQQSLYATIGLMIEDFETGDFSAFEWHHSGTANWTVSNELPFEGAYCTKSGVITDGQETNLWVSLIVVSNDVVTFQRKVSSEDTYDYLRFYIDDVMIDEWSGDKAWEQVSYPVAEGNHILRWSYQKDYSVSTGSDCAWIDEIIFPTTTTVIGVGESVSSADPIIYPNPNQGRFTVNIGNQSKINEISILNSLGMQIYTSLTSDQIIQLDLTGLSGGMYLLVNTADGKKSYSKFVVR